MTTLEALEIFLDRYQEDREVFIILGFRYKNAIIHISGDSDRETLEEAATRFFKKVYIQKKKNKEI